MSLTEEARAPFSLVDEINQVRHGIFPLFSWISRPCVFIYFDFREWISEPNAWCTTQWSMWRAKPRARNISWSPPSCCPIWSITKGWKSCVWITGSGCLMMEILARWWIWSMGMLQAGGGNEKDIGNVGFGPCGVREISESKVPLFFLGWWEGLNSPFLCFIYGLAGIFFLMGFMGTLLFQFTSHPLRWNWFSPYSIASH